MKADRKSLRERDITPIPEHFHWLWPEQRIHNLAKLRAHPQEAHRTTQIEEVVPQRNIRVPLTEIGNGCWLTIAVLSVRCYGIWGNTQGLKLKTDVWMET